MMHPFLAALAWIGLLLTEGTVWEHEEYEPARPVRSVYEGAGIPDHASRLTALIAEAQGIDLLSLDGSAGGAWEAYYLQSVIPIGSVSLGFLINSDALRRYHESIGERHWADLYVLFGAAFGELDHPMAGELAEECRRYFRVIADLAGYTGLEQAWEAEHLLPPRPPGSLLFQVGAEVGPARTAGRICAARMGLALLDGDADEFHAAFLHALSAARACAWRASVIPVLVSYSIQNEVLEVVIRGITEGRLDPVLCRRLLGTLNTHARFPPELAVEAERMIALDLIDRFYHRVVEGSPFADWPGGPLNLAVAGPRFERSMANWMFDRVSAYFAAGPHPDEQTAAAYRHMLRSTDTAAWAARHPILSMTFPPLGKFDSVVRVNRITRGGVSAMLALELHRAEHGDYPDALEQLVPAFLDELPPDPYSDGPLRYRRIDPAADELGRAYLLYSVGLDGEDNGGKRHPDRNLTAIGNRIHGAGFDYVINDPRQ